MSATSSDKDAIIRSSSHVPPTHFLLRINSFSILVQNDVEKYESGDFEAGGYKWKLVIYPSGIKSKNVEDHISLYLSMSDTSSMTFGFEVYAVFRFFLLNQFNDEFMIFQDALGRERRFRGLRLEWGFDRFIPLDDFLDASNGYLVEDACVFGAEVFVKERNFRKGEGLSMIRDATSFKHFWKIENFSKLGATKQESEVFTAGDHKWKVWLHPNGYRDVSGSYLSLYLALADLSSITPGYKIYTEFYLRIVDQVKASYLQQYPRKEWFSAVINECGFRRFVKISRLTEPGSGYLVKDVCVVEAEMIVLGISRPL